MVNQEASTPSKNSALWWLLYSTIEEEKVGSYIKSSDDGDICSMLTFRFSNTTINSHHPAHVPGHNETFIGQLRRHRVAERLFDGTHALERVSHRLAYSVGRGPTPTTMGPRKRWHWLLNAASGQLIPATRNSICTILDQVLQPISTVDYVTFDAQVAHTASGHFEVHPNNPTVPQTVLIGGLTVCLMVLDCPLDQQLPNPTPAQQPDPPLPDPRGETPINNIHVPPP
jgi:hypothetical protein